MKKIGIIGAMELEVETLKAKMEVKQTTKKAGMEFFEGTLNGVDAVIVRSGIGKVNAGICTQILVDLFAVTHIINTGVAGSLDAKIDIGDIVVSTDVCQHDMDVTVMGYQLGEVPQLGTLSFPADEKMAALAKSVCEKVNTEIKVFSCQPRRPEPRGPGTAPLPEAAQGSDLCVSSCAFLPFPIIYHAGQAWILGLPQSGELCGRVSLPRRKCPFLSE